MIESHNSQHYYGKAAKVYFDKTICLGFALSIVETAFFADIIHDNNPQKP